MAGAPSCPMASGWGMGFKGQEPLGLGLGS